MVAYCEGMCFQLPTYQGFIDNMLCRTERAGLGAIQNATGSGRGVRPCDYLVCIQMHSELGLT